MNLQKKQNILLATKGNKFLEMSPSEFYVWHIVDAYYDRNWVLFSFF